MRRVFTGPKSINNGDHEDRFEGCLISGTVSYDWPETYIMVGSSARRVPLISGTTTIT